MASKYNSIKQTVDNITFDSRFEANYYCELKLRKRAGEIKDFELQPEFILQEGFRHNGKKIQPIKYRADFKIIYPDGQEEIIDTKSKATKTKDYLLKKKMLLYKYPDINFTEVIK